LPPVALTSKPRLASNRIMSIEPLTAVTKNRLRKPGWW
jgi:hypothetical protein